MIPRSQNRRSLSATSSPSVSSISPAASAVRRICAGSSFFFAVRFSDRLGSFAGSFASIHTHSHSPRPGSGSTSVEAGTPGIEYDTD